jgi:POT family proton-dependent oligopeptide transporter
MMIFTVGFGQVEGALFLWAQDRTDRMLLGFELPAAWFVGLPALLVLLLAPAQLALLPWIQHRVSTPRLIAWGLVAVVLAFAVLIPPALLSNGHRVSMLWLIACMTLLVIGELLVAPLGLSLLLRLAPPRFVGVVVGVWYVAGALGCWLAGEIGAVWMR